VGVRGLKYVGVRRSVRQQNIKMIRKERDKVVTYVGVRRNVRQQSIKMIRKEGYKVVTYITYLFFLLFVNSSYCTTQHGHMVSIPVLHLIGINYYVCFLFFFFNNVHQMVKGIL
jgi:hypothetical protein